ncbi:hypothetical protein [Stieleria mannarensis]|uniref:hypothetical protein n=1 Tax=Stieleria mannarensis TaxID=2755585 RepID=UPI00160156B0|nr:hypothetical protein [Rhodopirellula sp. JC639]
MIIATQHLSHANDAFVRPLPTDSQPKPVWGHRDGLRIGLHPTPGPAGLIRVYAPYLDQQYPRVVNFISIEPSVEGLRGRGQSELEMSQYRPGERGLVFWASNQRTSNRPPGTLASGIVDEADDVLRLFIHTEPFRNGAHPIIECLFRKTRPYEIEFRIHVANDSAEMTFCTLSATMGNFGLLRRIHLKQNQVVAAKDLWGEEALDRLGFLPWRSWPAADLARTEDGRFWVQLSTDLPNPSRVNYDPHVAPNWRYVGHKATHYWRAESTAKPLAAVNGRKTYWMSQSPIPGGIAFENFELRMPFSRGQRLWFGVLPDEPKQNESSDDNLPSED